MVRLGIDYFAFNRNCPLYENNTMPKTPMPMNFGYIHCSCMSALVYNAFSMGGSENSATF